jgi:hypothetical protein
MKRVLLSLLLSIWLCLSLSCIAQEASSYLIQEINFLPVRYYVGDNVELRLRIEAPGRDLRPPEPLFRGNWLVVRDVSCTRIRGHVWEVRIFFTTFRPGRHVLPDIDLGSAMLTGLKAETRSILDDKGVDRPAAQKGQLLLPGTWRALIITVFFLFLLPPLLYRTLKGCASLLRRYSILRQRMLPCNRIMRALKRLEQRLGDYDCAAFFAQITGLLREYLNSRLDFPAQTSTTLELEMLLPGALARVSPSSETHSLTPGVIRLFQRADYVKFGGGSASQAEMTGVLGQVSQIVDGIEEVMQRVES